MIEKLASKSDIFPGVEDLLYKIVERDDFSRCRFSSYWPNFTSFYSGVASLSNLTSHLWSSISSLDYAFHWNKSPFHFNLYRFHEGPVSLIVCWSNVFGAFAFLAYHWRIRRIVKQSIFVPSFSSSLAGFGGTLTFKKNLIFFPILKANSY